MSKKTKKNLRKILVILGAIIFLILLIRIAFTNKDETTDALFITDLSSIEELLYYYECKNIQIMDSEEEQFKKDIYLTFGKDLWTDGKSNQAYYNSIVLNLTGLLNHQNYRLIDISRELIIGVIVNPETKTIDEVYINGELNYFEKQETKEKAGNFEKISETKFTIHSNEINKFIENDWRAASFELGTLESRFDDYDIYFDEGIEIKTLGGKVYNIVFTKNYKSTIVEDITVNSTKQEVIESLGEPVFVYEDMFGYKGEECYVFFANNQVSIYRREKDYNNDEFLELWLKFQENKDAKNFVKDLTEIWQDYNLYKYDSEHIELEYALKGVRVEFNVSPENGLNIYNNFEGYLGKNITLESLNKENLPEQVYLHTNEDLVYLNEIERFTKQMTYNIEEYAQMADENDYKEENDEESYKFTENTSNKFRLVYEYVEGEGIRNVKFVSIDQTEPNSELIRHISINTYGWLDDERFLYSVKGEGIFCYNASTRKLKTIITGKQEYKIEKIDGNKIFYDDTSIEI